VKGVRARLYYDAGLDTVEKISAMEPDKLRERIILMSKKQVLRGFLRFLQKLYIQ